MSQEQTEIGSKRDRLQDTDSQTEQAEKKHRKDKSHGKEKRHKKEKKEKHHKDKSRHKDKSKSKDKSKKTEKTGLESGVEVENCQDNGKHLENSEQTSAELAGNPNNVETGSTIAVIGSEHRADEQGSDGLQTQKVTSPENSALKLTVKTVECEDLKAEQQNGEAPETPESGEIPAEKHESVFQVSSVKPPSPKKENDGKEEAPKRKERSRTPSREDRDRHSHGDERIRHGSIDRSRDRDRDRDSRRDRERNRAYDRYEKDRERGRDRDLERAWHDRHPSGRERSSHYERESNRRDRYQRRSRSPLRRSSSRRPRTRSPDRPQRRSGGRHSRSAEREEPRQSSDRRDRAARDEERRPENQDEDDTIPEAVLQPEEDEEAIIQARRNRWKNIKQKYEAGSNCEASAGQTESVKDPNAEVQTTAAGATDPADGKEDLKTGSKSEVLDNGNGVPADGTGDDAVRDPDRAAAEGDGNGHHRGADSPASSQDGCDDVAGHDENSADDVELVKESDGQEVSQAKDGADEQGIYGSKDMESGLRSGLEPKREEKRSHKEKEADMFADEDEEDDADMFANKVDPKTQMPANKTLSQGLLDNWDDADGYYKFKIGEIIMENYQVASAQGRGVFSSVLKAYDLNNQKATGDFAEVAIKVIRANETMYKAGQLEREILRLLASEDKDGKRHCIKLLRSFEYRNHLCLVFENMSMNLRELVKKYGRDVGLNISAVRQYAEQLMIGLHHMHRCKVIHADIKPDNILVNDRHTIVKFCDFGSAMYAGDNDITPYLVSRFYRAPEIILGLPYDHALDMWSVGCVLYELFTGKILFPGRTNNEMLKLMMSFKGPFSKKMLRKGAFSENHFEGETLDDFSSLEEDPITKKPVSEALLFPGRNA